MVAGAVSRQEARRGLRPFNPTRDLKQVVDLMQVAFPEEVGRPETAWLRDLETLGSLKPIIWLLSQVNSLVGSLLHGFVWIEDGRIVGNATISAKSPAHWMVSNVAVHPDHRRRGIARELMDACVDWVQTRGAGWITLEVRRDNVPAKSLYLDLGFVVVEGVAEMERQSAGMPAPVAPPAGYQLRSARPGDGAQMVRLAGRATPPLAQRIEPLRERDFQVSRLERVVHGLTWLLGLPTTRHWVVLDQDGQVVAMLDVRAGGYSRNFRFLVDPTVRGILEETLVTQALDELGYHRGAVRTSVDADHPEAVSALAARGFREVRTLDRMALDLSQP